MSEHYTFVVLAGGMSSRFGGDKQIVEIDGIGRTIMELSILEAWRAGADRLVLVVNERVRPAIESIILPRLPGDLDVTLADQRLDQVPERHAHHLAHRLKIWGTGHALRAAAPYVEGNLIVANADDYYGKSAYAQLAALLGADGDWAMLGYPVAATLSAEGSVNRGICRTRGNYLESVTETYDIVNGDGGIRGRNKAGKRVAIAEDALASMAFWGFDDSIFGFLERGFDRFLETATSAGDEYVLTDEIEAVLAAGSRRIRLEAATDNWLGVTFQADLPGVTAALCDIYRGDDLAG